MLLQVVSMYDAINSMLAPAYETSKGFMQIGAFTTVARAVGMIGATIYIFSRIIGPIARGEEIDYFPLFRPFILLVAIAGSNQICNSLNTIFADIERGSSINGTMVAERARLNELMETRDDRYAAYMKAERDRRLQEYAKESSDNVLVEWGQTAWRTIRDGVSDSLDGVQEMLVKGTVYFFDGLGMLGYFCIILFSLFTTTMLGFIAPLAFAFAIFDVYSNNAAEWFAKYIHAKLMVLLCKAYTIFCYRLMMPFVLSSLEWETGQTFLYLIVVLVSLIGYTMIPSWSSMALAVGGMTSTSSAATGKAGGLAGAVTRSSAGAASGGIRFLGGAGAVAASGVKSAGRFLGNVGKSTVR